MLLLPAKITRIIQNWPQLRRKHFFEIILLFWDGVEYIIKRLNRRNYSDHMEQNEDVHADILVAIPFPEEAGG